ncbi:MAG: hypothetical protein N3G20_01710, partial [Verrucomicrobiae bacterium]|nr:hypothetical protein [Verrucomicrobiae bacterium]
YLHEDAYCLVVSPFGKQTVGNVQTSPGHFFPKEPAMVMSSVTWSPPVDMRNESVHVPLGGDSVQSTTT